MSLIIDGQPVMYFFFYFLRNVKLPLWTLLWVLRCVRCRVGTAWHWCKMSPITPFSMDFTCILPLFHFYYPFLTFTMVTQTNPNNYTVWQGREFLFVMFETGTCVSLMFETGPCVTLMCETGTCVTLVFETFSQYLCPFYFLLFEFHCTFSISYKILTNYVHYYCILIMIV